jgi:propanol-preferring alcohol dehydrogenase
MKARGGNSVATTVVHAGTTAKVSEGFYRAVQVVSPNQFELTEKPLVEPPLGYGRIRVEACGVCHSDAATVEGGVLPIEYPRVPGHEAVGRIDYVGEGVDGWEVGQRVGVGFLGGFCGYCERCRSGDLVDCLHQDFTGVQRDGGYAEVLIAKSTGLISVPEELSAVDAAPLLCAGLTTLSAIRESPAKAAELVAISGIGGLGHLAVQYARKMGFQVAAIDIEADKAELAEKLGAHHYIDSSSTNPAEALQALGGAALILVTASAGRVVAQSLGGLRRGGTVVALGASPDPVEASSGDLLFNSKKLVGALTGNPATGDATLKFSALSGVAPMVETMSLEEAPAAYARMASGQARFRIVLTMEA